MLRVEGVIEVVVLTDDCLQVEVGVSSRYIFLPASTIVCGPGR